jgi:DNA-binding MarR family transcriptional regulator
MSSKTKREVNPTADVPPLPTLLSQLLIAFTIEFDNEFEHRMPHRTTSFGAGAKRAFGPWLGSMVLWANAMRLVPDKGITVAELQSQARTESLQLAGLERWGYISVTPNPADTRPKPPQRDRLVRPTAAGRLAQEVWRPLDGVIEERWQERFGNEKIEALRKSLSVVLSRIDLALPKYLPILGYGLFSHILVDEISPSNMHSEPTLARMNLSALLAKVLLAFTIEFEFDWKISLPISANILRILNPEGTRPADLPRLSGISKEGVAFAAGWLERSDYAELEPDPKTGNGKLIRLTAKGEEAQLAYRQRLEIVDKRWRERFGEPAVAVLRESLLTLIHQRSRENGEQAALAEGLMQYPDGWRARKPYEARTLAFINDPAGALPHFPMVLHRGGYPDGS